MKSFCIFGVFVLLSVAELKAESSTFSCKARNLSVTVDDNLWLYFDGIEITNLPNAMDSYVVDVVNLPCTTQLIAIHGTNDPNRWDAGIIAATDDDYILTNSTWKCSNVSQSGWEEIDFDDSAWKSAIEYGDKGPVSGFNPNAAWIWLRQWNNPPNSTYEDMDMEVYCRKSLAKACDSNPCLYGGTCNNLDGDSFTCTCPIYVTGTICESPNYNEGFACGTTMTWSQYDAVNGFTRLCYFWTHVDDTEGRFTTCRNTLNGIPLYGNYSGLLNAGGNFGCVVSQRFPDDIAATSYLSCSDNFQQDVYLGNVSETDRLMVCIRYPYEGLPGRKQHHG